MHDSDVHYLEYFYVLINPMLMRRRVTVYSRFVCVSVCYHSSCSGVDLCCPSKIHTESAQYFEGLQLMDFAKSVLFKSYDIIYNVPLRSARPYMNSTHIHYAMPRKRRPLTALLLASLAGLPDHRTSHFTCNGLARETMTVGYVAWLWSEQAQL